MHYWQKHSQNKLQLSVKLQQEDETAKIVETTALVDSGATGSCIDKTFVEQIRWKMDTLPMPIPVYNADWTENKSGPIKQTVQLQLQIGAHVESITFGVTNLGKRKEHIFLGMDWTLTTQM
jgi:hypothetical protein